MTQAGTEIVILYSGGTDSTCAASIMAEKYKVLHLLTFKRLGFSCVENSKHNVELLRKKFPANIFIHRIMDTEDLAECIITYNYFKGILKYGFYALSNCVICALVNHLGALIYCLNNKIYNIADGITKDWPYFPSHMEKCIREFKNMYAHFNICYLNPVYDFELEDLPNLADKFGFAKDGNKAKIEAGVLKKRSTGNYLFESGLFPSPNIKGSPLDHKMQPRCSQFILHHLYLHWYFLAFRTPLDFEKITVQFLREKMTYFIGRLEVNAGDIRKILI